MSAFQVAPICSPLSEQLVSHDNDELNPWIRGDPSDKEIHYNGDTFLKINRDDFNMTENYTAGAQVEVKCFFNGKFDGDERPKRHIME